MHILSGFHVRQILDEVIAVPSGEVGKVFSGIISLNEIGRFLFEALQSKPSTRWSQQFWRNTTPILRPPEPMWSSFWSSSGMQDFSQSKAPCPPLNRS